MQRYTDYVTDQHGNPVFRASVLVTIHGSGVAAALFSDNGVTPKANPLTTDGLGKFWFYAADGRYDLTITSPNQIQAQVLDVLLEDPLEGSPAVFGDITANSLTLNNPLPPSSGGTGIDTYNPGQILVGNASGGLDATLLSSGDSKIQVTNGSGSVVVSAPGAAANGDNTDLESLTGLSGGLAFPQYISFDQAPSALPPLSQTAMMYWDQVARTIGLTMGNGVVQQMGEEVYYSLAKNTTGVTIPNGTPVSIAGSDGTFTLITPAIAGTGNTSFLFVGLTTEPIPNGGTGRVTYFGRVNDVDTSMFSFGDMLFVSPTVPGQLTNVKPLSPTNALFVGLVTKVGVLDGRITVRHETVSRAVDIGYDNTPVGLLATNVQSAIDELELTKADIGSLNTNVTIYPTNVASGIGGYFTGVISTTDPNFNVAPVNVATGAINANNQFIFGVIGPVNMLSGSPTAVNLTHLMNIAKSAGAAGLFGEFFYQIFIRDNGGVETLLCTSATTTGGINTALGVFNQYQIAALLNSGTWTATDRMVIKIFANLVGAAGATYNFQFGGGNPTRLLIPVPSTALPVPPASNVLVDTSTFNGILSGADNTVQKALNTIDDHNHDARYYQKTETYTKSETDFKAISMAIALG